MRKFRVTTLRRSALALAVLAVSGSGAAAQDLLDFGPDVASVTYGPYFRAEIGHSWNKAENGYWESPGAADPRILFDLGVDDGAAGAIALGYDWQNGWRGDLSLTRLVRADVSGPCSSATDGSSCATHANIESANFSATALMISVFYAPLEAQGSNSRFQPFVVGGLGVSRNEVGPWTRENTSGVTNRPTRTFEGDTSTDVAWSIGAGASWQVTRPGKRPTIILEGAWRYYDFGEAQGGSVPLLGNGESEPRTPLTFDARSSVVSFGVRIPLQRN